MMKIENGRYWNKPWSLVGSCTRISPGCKNCWSLAIEKRFHKGIEGQIVCHPERLSIPLKHRKPTVYAVWNDLGHPDVPFQFIWDTLRTAAFRPEHTFLALTKRPQKYIDFCKWVESEAQAGSDPRMKVPPYKFPENWWSGLTICNQQEADEKMMHFMDVHGKKFLSLEPLLGPINLENIDPLPKVDHSDVLLSFNCLTGHMKGPDDILDSKICAVILGGETGPGARPLRPDWVRKVRDDCAAAGVPFFFKGWGKNIPPSQDHNALLGKRNLDGRTHDDLPWVRSET